MSKRYSETYQTGLFYTIPIIPSPNRLNYGSKNESEIV